MDKSLQAAGDRQLAARLLETREVRAALEREEHKGAELGARRQLLATSTRLTREMAPDLHEVVDRCRKTLGIERPLELFVYPDSAFNAAAVRPERGRLFLLFSAALLEAFDAEELSFVVGHELGHYLFEHHRIPVGRLLGGGTRVGPDVALRLFGWQRYAELSADRTGLVCAGGLDPSARALFKLASGLRGDRIRIRVDQFVAQVGELRQEAEELGGADDAVRADWFATHPFSPLRIKAVVLYSEFRAAGASTDEAALGVLEASVDELMTLMEPSYLNDTGEAAEAMRRLLFAGGVALAVAAAAGKGGVTEAAIVELERLLGPGSIPFELKPERILEDLPRRIEAVKQLVPPLRRAQVLRDLCVIARADGKVDDEEIRILHDLALAIEVDPSLATCAVPAPRSAGPEAKSRRPTRRGRVRRSRGPGARRS